MVGQNFSWSELSVLVTGHTGFKGSWLSLYLASLGAKIHGYSLDPPTSPNLFDSAKVAGILESDIRADILDYKKLSKVIRESQPQVIFHLAAQPLVRVGYEQPITTFQTNVMGTINLLEIVRENPCVQAIIVITTDKVYENKEWMYAYREIDALGGYDPYSASKAATEIAVASYRNSFFSSSNATRIATARSGNVIGGGDWAKDRLIPDCLRVFEEGKVAQLRYPHAVRPWQHVLESIAGYIQLAEKLVLSEVQQDPIGWNFGPSFHNDATVSEVASILARLWNNNVRVEVEVSDRNPHEAGLLRLDINRARSELGWKPFWSIQETLAATVAWHRAWLDGKDMHVYTLEQILGYQRKARQI